MTITWNAQFFDPGMARFLGETASAAYQSEAELKKKVKTWKMELGKFFFPDPEDRQDTQAFIAQNESAVIIVFRGTESLKDWMTDADVQLVNGPAGKVHDGFQCGLNAVWRDLWKFLDEKRGQRTLWIAGHSLGGALATLATAKLRLEKGTPVNGLYTFGSPRVGNEEFARAFEQDFGERTFRFVNNNDIVPRVPFRLMNYRHVGKFIYFDQKGKINHKISWEQLLLTRVQGRIQELLKPGTDGIKDHSMVKYVTNLIKALPARPR